MKLTTGLAVVGRAIPGGVRSHAFVSLLVVGLLLGVGLRLVPSSTAAPAGQTGQDTPAATACAAQ
jgi:hypothetical protein